MRFSTYRKDEYLPPKYFSNSSSMPEWVHLLIRWRDSSSFGWILFSLSLFNLFGFYLFLANLLCCFGANRTCFFSSNWKAALGLVILSVFLIEFFWYALNIQSGTFEKFRHQYPDRARHYKKTSF